MSFPSPVGVVCNTDLLSHFLLGRTFPVDQFFLEDVIAMTRYEIAKRSQMYLVFEVALLALRLR